jgi:signal transduction histidine kinase
MNRRLIILTVIIAGALVGLTLLGYHAIDKWAEGLEWKRLGEFAEVAEQVRQDVKQKLDDFVEDEENRPYTHYQYFYIPDNIANFAEQTNLPLVRSPLAGTLHNGLAVGYFQIQPDGSITNANNDLITNEGATGRNNWIIEQDELNVSNVKDNLMPALSARGAVSLGIQAAQKTEEFEGTQLSRDKRGKLVRDKSGAKLGAWQRARPRQTENLRIESLERQRRRTQVLSQNRAIVETQIAGNTAGSSGGVYYFQEEADESTEQQQKSKEARPQPAPAAPVAAERTSYGAEPITLDAKNLQTSYDRTNGKKADAGGLATPGPRADDTAQQFAPYGVSESAAKQRAEIVGVDGDSESRQASRQELKYAGVPILGDYPKQPAQDSPTLESDGDQSDTVLVRIEPFVPIVVPGGDSENSIFGGQVFLLRHVQIEDRHVRQGFQLDEARLIEDVRESAAQFMRDGMTFELPQVDNGGKVPARGDRNIAYEAVLDFGFGRLILYLLERDPAWIGSEVGHLRNLYFSIVAIVFAAAALGMASLWRYARAQIKLAEKKDDFISAVSHELRTPLTSIRMYSEMLENKWVKSEQKLVEYYKSMRQESERLSRLIENVLDFSRIQKGRRKFRFSAGDLNQCVEAVAEMMRPYAVQNGFSIQTDFEPLAQTAFDNDAVKQIVVNLLDNAIKYARNATDRTITVRTRGNTQYVFIEVEDHGPGVPHRQRKKIFEEFYRTEAEATRETVGTGLGLALVRKFAQAHNGFVEILTAKPAGAIFRVSLAAHS